MTRTRDVPTLVERAREGDPRSVARLISLVEDADPALPVQVGLEAFNPKVPLDAKNSAIPCAVYDLTVENPGERSVAVSFLATQQNAAGLVETMPPAPPTGRRIKRRPPERWAVVGRSSDQYGGNRNAVLRTDTVY